MRIWKAPVDLAGAPPARDLHRITLELRFISPVFGAGVDPKRFDEKTPVRAASIRGQLRYWWRATHGDLTLDALRARETALFGGLGGGAPVASAVHLCVRKQPTAPRKLEVFERGSPFRLVNDRFRALAYGAFPLRGTDVANTHDVLWVYPDVFQVELLVKQADLDELGRALWAWLHFGGLGGRTRRGFGALALTHAQGWGLRSIPQAWPGGRRPQVEWPVLGLTPSSVVRTQRHVPTGQAAQELLLELLWKMRQGSLGRSAGQGTGRPGRSRWPDADALRRLYNNPSTRHRTPVHNPPINKLPRAAFGAPIIYHFKTEPGDREPPDTTLVPMLGAPLNRLASPLVLRPHALDSNNYEGLALTLEHPAATGWALLERRGLPRAVSVDLSSAEAGRVIPMTVGTAVYTDPLAAYLARVPAL